MTILIIIIAIILAVATLLLIVALFTNKDYSVERQIVIDKPALQVFDYIKYLKNMDHYNKWVMTDPTMRKDYRGTDGTEGFSYSWDSDNKQAGQGEQMIKKITDGRKMDYQIQFIKPFAGFAESSMETLPVDQRSTTVKWSFASKMAYPMNVVLIFMDMGEMLGKDMAISLNNLKQILEDQP